MKEEKRKGERQGRNGEEEECKGREKKEEREGGREKEIETEKKQARFAQSPQTIVCFQPGRRILQLRTTCLKF